jgi:S-adenosylmethionine/arginine decarboxylase-like enzyme
MPVCINLIMNKLLKQLSLIFIAILSITLISWSVKGHRTIAIIAEKHLNTHTANVVFANLKGKIMIDASTWADEIRNQPQYKNTSSCIF